MIGKVKLTRDGGYDPENPQPDPTLEPPRPARDGETRDHEQKGAAYLSFIVLLSQFEAMAKDGHEPGMRDVLRDRIRTLFLEQEKRAKRESVPPARDGEALSGPPFDEDELSAIARDYSATVVANLVASYRALRAELDQAREWAQSAELARAKSSAEADQLRAEVADASQDVEALGVLAQLCAMRRWVEIETGPSGVIVSVQDAQGNAEVRGRGAGLRGALAAARAASGEDASHQQTGRARQERDGNG